jgi:RNA polymerase sigma-70 factor (ECF subfamily)
MIGTGKSMSNGGATAVSGTPQRQPALLPLIRRMAAGDQGAAGALYDETSQNLFALAVRICGNAEDAEEVLHDAYCRAWRNAASYDESRGSVMSWLVLMTRSIAIDLVRSRKRVSSTLPIEGDAAEIASGERSPETRVCENETVEQIRRALDCLTPEQRQAVELAFYRGFTHSEMAEHLQVPLGTVKTRVRTGLLRLREALSAVGA